MAAVAADSRIINKAISNHELPNPLLPPNPVVDKMFVSVLVVFPSLMISEPIIVLEVEV